MGKALGAYLLNPPLTSGERTHKHLAHAAAALGCDDVRIANLFPIATRGYDALREVAVVEGDWESARGDLLELTNCDVLVVGWGLRDLGGRAGRLMLQQRHWLIDTLSSTSRLVWTVGDGPRHPSRWHQYVSDRHGRAGAGDLQTRLSRVLSERDPLTLA